MIVIITDQDSGGTGQIFAEEFFNFFVTWAKCLIFVSISKYKTDAKSKRR